MKRCDRRAQMKLSFGMMFSIILIVIFLIFTFFAIKTLLGMNDTVKIGQFYDSLQDDVDKVWKASQGSQEKTYNLPQKIKKVCFVDYGESRERGLSTNTDMYEELRPGYHTNENVIFFPLESGGDLSSFYIQHIDIVKITENDDPLCFENRKGKITLNIEKEYGTQLVTIN
jgi:hypothetical protein